MLPVLIAGVATFASTMAGGLAVIRWPGRLDLLLVFAGGVVLAAALGDLLPEALRQADKIDASAILPVAMLVAGFVTFAVVESVSAHDHQPVGDPGHAGIAGASGFALHSFFDGLAIGLGFGIDTSVGLVVAVAVLGHDFSDGLNTIAYLTARGQSSERSRRWLLIIASMPMLGALVGTVVPVPELVFPIALGFFSGWFLYAATVTMLPRARNLPLQHAVPAALLGCAAMFLVSRAA